MKRYQALVLGAVISTGSFILGMNQTSVQFVQLPVRHIQIEQPEQSQIIQYEKVEISDKENKYLDNIMVRYNTYREDIAKFEIEEIDFKDTGVIDAIKLANKTILENDRDIIRNNCRMYKFGIRDKFQVNTDLKKFDSSTIKVSMVIDICKMVGVTL